MAFYDIIPDIHGQTGKLEALLRRLGYSRANGSWRHGEPDRQIVFLGDFIDRGPDNAGVLRTVRELMEAGRAVAVMGNHELNAIHFHNRDERTRELLRPHTAKNVGQHASFLAEFPVGSKGAREWTDWMAGLPLWLDLGPFRVVHACWSEAAVARLAQEAPAGILAKEQLLVAAHQDHPLHDDVETLTKGPEVRLTDGYTFTDKGGVRRCEVRLAWWRREAATWAEAAISVPDPFELPDGPLPDGAAAVLYPPEAKPVFFGHYWLDGAPRLEAPNALCLDCSAGTDGPLIAYAYAPGATELAVEAIVGHPDIMEGAVR